MNTVSFAGRTLVFLLLVLLVVMPVYGLGMMPASQTILVGKDSQEFSFTIVNNERQDLVLALSVEGDLAEFVEIDKNLVVLSRDKSSERVNVRVNVPEESNIREGEHITRIFMTQVGRGSGEVSARLGLSFRINTIIPYTNAYLDVKLFTPNFGEGRSGNFIVQAENRGIVNAVNAMAVVDIYSPTNERLATLTSERKLVRSGETVNFALPLTSELQSGRYTARASIVYDGPSGQDEKVFTVGSPDISIDSISTAEFSLGGIAGFDILLSSNWGEEIRGVYADVEFKRGNELLERTRTASANIQGFERAVLPAYWDTSGLSPGRYDMHVSLHYLDRRTTEAYDVVLEQNRVSVVGVGQVVAEREGFLEGTGVLVVIVLILVLLNGLLIYKFVIRKKK